MVKSLLTKQILTEIININPNELNGDINNIILSKIKNKLENTTINEGYIINNSIQFLNKSMGKIININNKSKISYSVKFEALFLTPTNGVTIPCYVSSFNKMGAVAYIKLSDFIDDYNGGNTFTDSPFIIIIPNIEDINIPLNKQINIVIRKFRIKYNSSSIQVIGEYID